MAGEDVKEKTFDVLHFVADNAGLSIFEAIEKAYNMGVSEQKAVLDKVKEDIQENIDYNRKMDYQGIVAGLLLTLNIIRKAEGSEVKNEQMQI